MRLITENNQGSRQVVIWSVVTAKEIILLALMYLPYDFLCSDRLDQLIYQSRDHTHKKYYLGA